MKNKIIFSLIILLISLCTEITNSKRLEVLEPIIVTGNMIPKTLKKTGSSLTIINKEEIEKSGFKYLSQILSGTPGFQAYQSGGPHTLSRAFIRGNETDHTLVLIDGLKTVDPATGSNSVNLERITLSGVKRIEILRGSQSALYGSDAIGGVINIILEKGTEKIEKNFSSEISSRLDKMINTNFRGKVLNSYYSVNLNHLEGPGISAAEKSLGYEENDSYNIDNGYFILDYYPDEKTSVSLTTRYYSSEIQEDDAPNGPIYDEEMHTNLLDWQSGISLIKKYDNFTLDLSASTAKARRYQLKEDIKHRRYIGNLNSASIKFVVPMNDYESIVFCTETERSHMEQRTEYNDYDFKVSSTSKIISYSNNFYKNIFVDASFRNNSHDTYGNSYTYRLASSLIIPSLSLRIHSSYGTGYRAPTLDEIYGSYGNSNIKEERSRSRDLGFEYISEDKKLSYDITFFSTHIEDLIGYGPAPDYLFENQGSAKSNGVELYLKNKINKNVELNFNYNFLTSNNNGKSLQRRRKHNGKTNLKLQLYEFPEIISYSTLEFHSQARDDAFEGAHLSGYLLMHSNIKYKINTKKEIYFKLENLLDQKYHLADTAGTYGRTLTLGINMKF